MCYTTGICHKAVLHTISNSSMATSKDSGAGREDDVWKRCLKLDGDCCVITGASHPHVYLSNSSICLVKDQDELEDTADDSCPRRSRRP